MPEQRPIDGDRQRARRILDALPASASYDEILRALAFDRQIRRGLADRAARRVSTTSALRQRLREWHG